MSVLSNGYLLALTATTGIDFDAEFLVIAGGGQATALDAGLSAGGGAGGYISAVSGESSGGGASALSAVGLTTGDVTYSVTVGAAGSNSIFSGTDNAAASFNHTAIAGGGSGSGYGDDGLTGGSGGGGNTGRPAGSGGAGTTGQGYAGGDSEQFDTAACEGAPGNWSQEQCINRACGGGGGAGGAASSKNGGVGVQSSITGTATYYAGGGYANETTGNNSSGSNGTAGNGQSNYGGGGNVGSAGQNGVVILRYPDTVTISNSGGGLTMSTATDGSNKVTTITAGTGSIEFTPA